VSWSPVRGLRSACVTVLGALACSSPSTYSTGTGGPVPWTPGRYVLEATVGRGSLSDQDFSAILTIAPDGSASMESSTGICRDPRPDQAGRDDALSQRTFECGDALYMVRPTPAGVRGRISATILEEYEARVPCPPTSNQTVCTIMRTERVTRGADLTVSPLE
jgi:hypothetical protein